VDALLCPSMERPSCQACSYCSSGQLILAPHHPNLIGNDSFSQTVCLLAPSWL
jgi:hypothetical protein